MNHPTLSSSQYKRLMLILCYATYCIFGVVLGMRTNIFLFIQRDYLDNYQHIATLILISGICMQLTLFWAGHLIERIGFHKVLGLGVAIAMIPLALMFFVNSARTFDLSYTIFMFGYGFVVLALNLFVSHLVPERKGNALLILHLFFALGALCGPRWVSLCTDRKIPWQHVISLTATIPLLLIFLTIIISGILAKDSVRAAFPVAPKIMPATKDERDISSTREFSKVLQDPFIWLFILVFVCSQIWEYGIGTWFVIFANNTRGLSSSEAALYLTLFYASYPLIRILFSRIIHRLNLLIVILGAFTCCILFGGLGMLTDRLFFYSLTGMGIALMYPGIMAAMQQIFGEGSTKKIGFITMAGGMIQYAAIWSVGLISDQLGIQIGFTSMLAYLIIGAGAVAGILLLVRRREVQANKN
ncbi:MAG: MFS transporter [Spirochaetales bacterium]|nr:MFS transporter [Spirochaetales bacterium]